MQALAGVFFNQDPCFHRSQSRLFLGSHLPCPTSSPTSPRPGARRRRYRKRRRGRRRLPHEWTQLSRRSDDDRYHQQA